MHRRKQSGAGLGARRRAPRHVLIAPLFAITAVLLAGCVNLPSPPSTISVIWDSKSPVSAGAQPHSASFVGVVCTSDTDCVAYGSEMAAHNRAVPLIVARHGAGATWTPTALPLPAGAQTSEDSPTEVASMSCVHDACLSVSSYADPRNVLHFFSNTFEPTSEAISIPLSGAALAASERGTGLDEAPKVSLACRSSVDCIAGISIVWDEGGSSQHDAFELMHFDGQNWTSMPLPKPAIPAGWGSSIDQISCTTDGWCAITGDAQGPDGDSSLAWSAVPAFGGWRTTVERSFDGFAGLSCDPTHSCRALAETANGSALVTVRATGTSVVRTLPGTDSSYAMGCSTRFCAFGGTNPDFSTGYLTTLTGSRASSVRAEPSEDMRLGFSGTVDCERSKCIAVGGYQFDTNQGNSKPLVELYTGHTWKASSPPLPKGMDSGLLTGVACGSEFTCVAIGQAGADVHP